MAKRNAMNQSQSQRQFPVEVYQIAAQHRLGQPVERLRQHLSGCSTLLISGVMFYLAILCLGVIVLSLIPGVIDNPPPLAIAILLLVIGIIAIPIGVVLFWFFLRTRNPVYECEEGFMILQRRSRQMVMAMRWDDLRDVKRRSGGRSGTSYYLIDRRGSEHLILSRSLWLRCRKEVRQRTTRVQ